jgi:hypothetical protein
MKRKSESLALGSTFALYTEKIPASWIWVLEASSTLVWVANRIHKTTLIPLIGHLIKGRLNLEGKHALPRCAT